MADWSKTLCKALDDEEPSLAAACGLNPKLDGPDFEQALGKLLEWERVRYLEDQYQALGRPKIGGETKPGVIESREYTSRRLGSFKHALNQTLYTQFSHIAVDEEKAVMAYGNLLAQLGNPNIVLATTNYDRSAESALLRLNREIRNGFAGKPPRRQLFKPGNLVQGAEGKTPLLHLHGAVGWYERDGEVVLENAEERFDANRGSPVVLYPDPQKEPVSNAIVAELWREFDIAIGNAPRILVLGHSLHDRMLLERLESLDPEQRLAVSAFTKDDRERVSSHLPRGISFQFDFGPDADLPDSVVKRLRP